MSIRAADIRRNNIQQIELKKNIHGILYSIDTDIKNALNAGLKSITYNAPIQFSVPNMTNKEAQREIYSEIISSLKKRKYNVQIDLNHQDRVTFYIDWILPEDEVRVKMQTDIIARHSKRTSD